MIARPAIALAVAKNAPGTRQLKVPPSYARFLVRAAESLGWTREEFSRRANRHPQTLDRLLNGRPEGSPNAAMAYRQALIDAGMKIPAVPAGIDDWIDPQEAMRAASVLDPESETIRAHLVEARERARISVDEASARSGIPGSMVVSYELGKETPSGAHVRALAKAYGYRTDDIVEPDPLPAPSRAARPVIWLHVDAEGVEQLLDSQERSRLESIRAEISAMNEEARKRASVKK